MAEHAEQRQARQHLLQRVLHQRQESTQPSRRNMLETFQPAPVLIARERAQQAIRQRHELLSEYTALHNQPRAPRNDLIAVTVTEVAPIPSPDRDRNGKRRRIISREMEEDGNEYDSFRAWYEEVERSQKQQDTSSRLELPSCEDVPTRRRGFPVYTHFSARRNSLDVRARMEGQDEAVREAQWVREAREEARRKIMELYCGLVPKYFERVEKWYERLAARPGWDLPATLIQNLGLEGLKDDFKSGDKEKIASACEPLSLSLGRMRRQFADERIVEPFYEVDGLRPFCKVLKRKGMGEERAMWESVIWAHVGRSVAEVLDDWDLYRGGGEGARKVLVEKWPFWVRGDYMRS